MSAWLHPPPDLSVSCTDCTPPADRLTVKCLRGYIHFQVSQFRAQIVLHQQIDLPWNVCVATSTSRSLNFVHRLYSTSRWTYREMFAWLHPPPDLSISCTDCTPPADRLTVKCLHDYIHLQISQFRAQIVLHQQTRGLEQRIPRRPQEADHLASVYMLVRNIW